MPQGKTIETFLCDGSLTGIREISIEENNCKCFVIPKSEFNNLDKEQQGELESYSLYFLLGDGKKVYVGQSGNAYTRINTHIRGKDFWHTAIVFLSKNRYEPLGNDSIRYFEYLAFDQIQMSAFQLEYGQTPSKPDMSRSSRNSADIFFSHIKMLTSFLGYPLFEKSRKRAASRKVFQPVVSISQPTQQQANQPAGKYRKQTFASGFYTCKKGVTNARGEYNPETDKMVVLAGSEVVKKEGTSLTAAIKKIRQKILTDSQLAIDKGDYYVLTQPVSGLSPTKAAIFCLGRISNAYGGWGVDANAHSSSEQDQKPVPPPASAEEHFYCRGNKESSIDAQGVHVGDGRVRVLAGSKITKGVLPSYRQAEQRAELIRENATDEGNYYVLNKDVEFDNPSAAANFCHGAHTNGWDYWVRKSDNKTLDEVYRKGK